jgi:dephospho-CoA kinase
MNKIKIILVSGKARSGKGEFSRILKESLETKGEKVVQTLFAKYIKQYAIELGWDGVTKDSYWRDFLQKIGTELIQYDLNMKTFHPNRISEDIQILSHFGVNYFIIDDCRFRREVYFMKAMFPDDVITVRVESNNSRSDLNEEQLKHQSEIDLDEFKFDCNFQNNGTIEDLKKQVRLFIQLMLTEE